MTPALKIDCPNCRAQVPVGTYQSYRPVVTVRDVLAAVQETCVTADCVTYAELKETIIKLKKLGNIEEKL